MPAKNVVKTYAAQSFYHVYNRGVSKQRIFLDEQDYEVFISLFKRYLVAESERQANRASYPYYGDELKLVAYCLMPNHFHLLLYQDSQDAMKFFLKSLATSYSMYFNKKYGHVGALFQQRYRAVRIDNDSQLTHISRYIHMNPQDYEKWQWSSLQYYLSRKHAPWLTPDLLPVVPDYLAFLNEYKHRRDELAHLKDELAG